MVVINHVPILAGLGAAPFFFAVVVAFLIGILATLADDDCGGAEGFALAAAGVGYFNASTPTAFVAAPAAPVSPPAAAIFTVMVPSMPQ